MTERKHTRPKIGDIIEIETPKGWAYAQYTHHNKEYSYLIRILPGIYTTRLNNFKALIQEQENFFIFFPLGPAVNRDIVTIVGHEEVPDRIKPFPLMRARGGIDRQGHVLNWWLWDGEKEWRVDKLTPDQQKLSIAEICNDTLLIEYIVSGWSPTDVV